MELTIVGIVEPVLDGMTSGFWRGRSDLYERSAGFRDGYFALSEVRIPQSKLSYY